MQVIDEAAVVEPDRLPFVRRGGQVQVTDTMPRPPAVKTWIDGAFVNAVQLPAGPAGFAFTLDDGPSPYNTEIILRGLAAYDIHATFFLIGSNVRAWPDIARRIRDEGHEIGNHSVYHSPYESSPLAGQIGPNQAIIHDATGVVPVVNRAPGLTRGQIILDTCATLGMYELHTTLDQNDWRSPRRSVSELVAEASREYRPGTFSLNHDGGATRPTATGWTQLVDVALAKGLVPVTATELVGMGVPVPGGRSYSGSGVTIGPSYLLADATCTCSYDPRVELTNRLDDPTVKRAERSRIVEVLADIEEHERAG